MAAILQQSVGTRLRKLEQLVVELTAHGQCIVRTPFPMKGGGGSGQGVPNDFVPLMGAHQIVVGDRFLECRVFIVCRGDKNLIKEPQGGNKTERIQDVLAQTAPFHQLPHQQLQKHGQQSYQQGPQPSNVEKLGDKRRKQFFTPTRTCPLLAEV